MLRRVLAWCVWWVALFWLWMLLVGVWNPIVIVGGACAATVAASLAELARGELRAWVPLDWLRRAASIPVLVVVDFALVVWVLAESLVRRRVRRGVFVVRTFPVGEDDARGRGIRAFATVAATYSPNAYVIEIDPERRLVLLHDLVRWRRSESPA